MYKANDIEKLQEAILSGEKTSSKAESLWRLLFVCSLIFLTAGLLTYLLILKKGLAVLPIGQTVLWGNLIVNFVFWIGIAHAGTFISAVLLLLNQEWRLGINRFAEAMTIICIALAGLYVILHLGKPALFYYLFPAENKTSFFLLNFSSALNWDFYAILSYLIVSIMFFHIGFLPDFGLMRDKSTKKWKQNLFNFLAMGWTASYRHWVHQEKILYILAGIVTALVISVHSIVSLDFAVTLKTGWHTTLYPLYFVVGALFSGFAMLAVLSFISMKTRQLQLFIRPLHYSNMSKIMLVTSIILILIFFNEVLFMLIEGMENGENIFMQKLTGNHAHIYILSLVLTLLLPHLFWRKSIRENAAKVMIISILILIGMWLERFVIVISTAQYVHLNASWVSYKINLPTIGITVGAIGFMMCFFLLFIRFLPPLSIYELKKDQRKNDA